MMSCTLLEAELVDLAARGHAAPVEEALDEPREALGLGDEERRALLPRRVVGPRALDRLGEEADGGERRAELVTDLRHEVGLELGEVGLSTNEHEHEHDAGDDDGDEADREDPEEQVDPRLEEHLDDADREEQHRGDDDEVDEQLDDAPVPHPLEVLRRDLPDVLVGLRRPFAHRLAGHLASLSRIVPQDR